MRPAPRALCFMHPNADWWFATQRKDSGGWNAAERAKAICRVCPVRVRCLEGALARGERWGIWGGLDEQERAALLVDIREQVVA